MSARGMSGQKGIRSKRKPQREKRKTPRMSTEGLSIQEGSQNLMAHQYDGMIGRVERPMADHHIGMMGGADRPMADRHDGMRVEAGPPYGKPP